MAKAPVKKMSGKLDVDQPVSAKDAAAMRKQQADAEMERKMREAAKKAKAQPYKNGGMVKAKPKAKGYMCGGKVHKGKKG